MKELKVKRLEVNSAKLSAISVTLPCFLLTEEGETVKLEISESVSIREYTRDNSPRPSEIKPRWLQEEKKG